MRSMKKILSLLAGSALALSLVAPVQAADVDMGVDFATAYVFRGVQVNDSWVAQPYVEIGGFPGFAEGLAIGTWGNFDVHDGPGGSPESGQFSEVDFYASYALPLGLDPFSLSVGYTEYAYPNSDLEADREFNVVLEVDVLLNPYLSVNPGVAGAMKEQVYFETGISEGFEFCENFGADAGGTFAFLTQPEDSTADDGLSFAAVFAGLTYEFLSAGVTYYFETDDKVTIVDKEIVGTIGASFSF